LASPTVLTWNQIDAWSREARDFRNFLALTAGLGSAASESSENSERRASSDTPSWD